MSAVPDAAIIAQHAFVGPQSDNPYSRRDGTTRNQASDATAQILFVHSQMDNGNMTGMQSSRQQLSSKAPFSGHYVNDQNSSNENQIPGVGAAGLRYVTPIPNPLLPSNSPLSETTATLNAKAENAYVSFDEWQAQVRAKQLRMPDRINECNSSTGDQQSVAGQRPSGELSGIQMPGNIAEEDGVYKGAHP